MCLKDWKILQSIKAQLYGYEGAKKGELRLAKQNIVCNKRSTINWSRC